MRKNEGGITVNALFRKEIYSMNRVFLFFTPIIFLSAIQSQGSYQFIIYVFTVSAYYVMVSNMPDKNVPNSSLLIQSLPIKRSTIILAKYCSPLMWFCFAISIYLIFAGVFSFTIAPFPTLSELVLVFCMLYLYVNLYYPLYYRGGYNFSSVICVAFLLFPFIAKIFFANLLSMVFDGVLQNPIFIFSAFILTLLITFVSFFISNQIYEKYR